MVAVLVISIDEKKKSNDEVTCVTPPLFFFFGNGDALHSFDGNVGPQRVQRTLP